jgi:hypothetical protein
VEVQRRRNRASRSAIHLPWARAWHFGSLPTRHDCTTDADDRNRGSTVQVSPSAAVRQDADRPQRRRRSGSRRGSRRTPCRGRGRRPRSERSARSGPYRSHEGTSFGLPRARALLFGGALRHRLFNGGSLSSGLSAAGDERGAGEGQHRPRWRG